MKNPLFVLLLMVVLFLAVSVSPVHAGDDKLLICHYPPGNPDNTQLIEVSASAWPAHQAHGDFDFTLHSGSCGPQTP